MTAAKNLPQRIRDFLASHPHRGEGLNVWLFGAALRLHRYMADAEIPPCTRQCASPLPMPCETFDAMRR